MQNFWTKVKFIPCDSFRVSSFSLEFLNHRVYWNVHDLQFYSSTAYFVVKFSTSIAFLPLVSRYFGTIVQIILGTRFCLVSVRARANITEHAQRRENKSTISINTRRLHRLFVQRLFESSGFLDGSFEKKNDTTNSIIFSCTGIAVTRLVKTRQNQHYE